MGKITDIVRQKGNKTRVSLFLDGAFLCGLDELTAMQHRLEIGREIDADEIARLQAESEYRSALDRAMNRLAVRPRSEYEIRDFLKSKGYMSEVSDKVCDRLFQLGYLDDGSYARQYIDENKSRYGAIRLKNELIKRGVSRDIIEEQLAECDRGEAVAELARSLFKSCGGDKYKLKNKLYAKGCNGDDISSALEILEDEGLFDE